MSEKRVLLGFLLVASFSFTFWSFSSGPHDGRAGNPPDNLTCWGSTCHGSFDLNSGDGSFSLDNVPEYYVPGVTSTIFITLSDPGQSRWGFELTVLDGNNQQAGTIGITDTTNTQLSDNTGTYPDYIKHTRTGTFRGTQDGPVTWSFDWTAPSPALGDVTFYAAGNAANNNGTTEGNYVYTTTTTSSTCVRGNANDDGIIDVLDALTVVGYILGGPPIIGESFCRADCNGDDEIDVLDILGIVNVILGTGTCP